MNYVIELQEVDDSGKITGYFCTDDETIIGIVKTDNPYHYHQITVAADIGEKWFEIENVRVWDADGIISKKTDDYNYNFLAFLILSRILRYREDNYPLPRLLWKRIAEHQRNAMIACANGMEEAAEDCPKYNTLIRAMYVVPNMLRRDANFNPLAVNGAQETD